MESVLFYIIAIAFASVLLGIFIMLLILERLVKKFDQYRKIKEL